MAVQVASCQLGVEEAFFQQEVLGEYVRKALDGLVEVQEAYHLVWLEVLEWDDQVLLVQVCHQQVEEVC